MRPQAAGLPTRNSVSNRKPTLRLARLLLRGAVEGAGYSAFAIPCRDKENAKRQID